jgi:hypothetical protein
MNVKRILWIIAFMISFIYNNDRLTEAMRARHVRQVVLRKLHSMSHE